MAWEQPFCAPDCAESYVETPCEFSVPTSTIWGVPYARVTMDQAIACLDTLVQRRKATQVITANLNFAMLHQNQPALVEATRRAAMVLCDGMPILWRSRLGSNPLPERVAGSDLIYRIASLAAHRGYRVYFLGGAEGVAQQAADRLVQLNPGLIVAGVECPPFRNWSAQEQLAMVDRIDRAGTDILLVAFGQPKGELWLDAIASQCRAPVSLQLGASFDFVAGTARRAPTWMQKTGLEWLYRAACDPKRLVPRYFKNLLFLFQALRRDVLNATS
jgi:N-acetylglucosaminyldiphosphoundecaprenol N-acetyl-beta-D-mannosaminyltransferase